ncbi:hypothetical protein FEM33_13830 [Dyadobacter flavalbus]|uniref:Lipoprotein n=1 Tax=Dyadobacter flavalbus TaxID=2579942 RepID=A0A5M8QWB4_9BACT|nr:hypothetical protein [Dyadobacter flavalbus]KAA6439340.1 hypothetical protein FEM33_13830 [Dyadobacter flavalbus]
MFANLIKVYVYGLILLSVLTSCASVRVKEVKHVEAKASDCRLPVFRNASEISGAYDVLCDLESITGSSLYVRRSAEAAIKKAMPAACRCGADAVLVISSGRTNLSFFSWRRGVATLQAIQLNHSAIP